MDLFLVRAHLLIHRQLPSPCILTWQRENVLVSSFLCKGTDPTMGSLSFWHKHYFSKTLPPNTNTLGIKVLAYTFGEDTNIQSIAATIFNGYTTVRKKAKQKNFCWLGHLFLKHFNHWWSFIEIFTQLSWKCNQWTGELSSNTGSVTKQSHCVSHLVFWCFSFLF